MKHRLADFESLEKVLRGKKKAQRVHFVELGIDEEIIKDIIENVMGKKWIAAGEETWQDHLRQTIDFYYAMGYDCVPVRVGWQNLPKFKERKTADTAALSKGQRGWTEEAGGIIKNFEDFEKLGWDTITHDLRDLNYAEQNLPEGMKITVCTVLFEMALEVFFGYEDLFIFSYDNPELVDAVLQGWGRKVYEAYKEVAQRPGVGAIFHGDDLAYKTGTMLSPEFLRKNIFPWFKKYADVAHKHGKMFWYHSCGKVSDVMDDLIEDVKIDAFHSFQDVILPVGDFMKKYGDRVAALGGIDVDKLARLDEEELRDYVRSVLDQCSPGRFALGSGNSVANYIPSRNYLAMIDEGLKWRR